jgi:YD repeat-containing protein
MVDPVTFDVLYQYDANGNLESTTYEDGSQELFTYDAVGNVESWTNRRGQTVTYAYNSAGLLTTKDYLVTPGFIDFGYTYNSNSRTGRCVFGVRRLGGWLTFALG